MSLLQPVKNRAVGQASSNTETHNAKVTKTYADANGNITAADVRLDGYAVDLIRVSNSSGLKLIVGGFRVLVNWARGSRFAPQIVGASGSESSAVLSGTTQDTFDDLFGLENKAIDLSGIPFLLQSEDTEDTPDGFVELPGANVLFEDTDPSEDSTGGKLNGTRTVDVKVLVPSALPDAQSTTLRDGTLANLVDSYGESQGLYRLDLALGAWVRVDVEDHKVKATGADQAPDYLFNSLVAGDGIELELVNPGGDEKVRIKAAAGSGSGMAFGPLTNGRDGLIFYKGEPIMLRFAP